MGTAMIMKVSLHSSSSTRRYLKVGENPSQMSRIGCGSRFFSTAVEAGGHGSVNSASSRPRLHTCIAARKFRLRQTNELRGGKYLEVGKFDQNISVPSL